MSSIDTTATTQTNRRNILKWLLLLPTTLLVKESLGSLKSSEKVDASLSNTFMDHWNAKYVGSPISHLQKIKNDDLDIGQTVRIEYVNEAFDFVKGIPLSKTELAIAALFN